MRRSWLSVRAVVAILSVLAPGIASADGVSESAAGETKPVVDLESLLAGCAKMPGLSARFTEEKQIALLAVPLRSAGTLHFTRGKGLVRHTTTPSKQSVLVTDKEVVFWDGKVTKRVSLASSETVETFARAFTMILAADRPGLEKSFNLDFRPKEGRAGWTLKLVPKSAALKNVIAAIEIEGQGSVLSLLAVREANGDVSMTRFSDVDTTKRYSDDEARRIFQVPPT